MKYLKSGCALIIILLFCTAPIQTQAQTATAAQTKEIQDILDKMKDLKDKGKKDDDPAIKKLAKEAIALADSFYKIPPENLNEEPEYDPGYGGDGKSRKAGKKVKVKLGPAAFSSPGWLASSKLHEIAGHGGQASSGRWYNDAKGSEINEVEAYDAELADSTKNGLSRAEIDELLRRRKEEHYDLLDSANRAKIDSAKNAGTPYKLALLQSSGRSRIAFTKSSELFIAGTVLSEERMLVTVRGKSIEGTVVSAELNGKKTETHTDANGNAFLDMSAIAGGLVGTAVATIKMLDSKGNEISSANTTVQQGHSMIFNRPEIGQLPDNLPSGDVVTISGKNLGADAHLVLGDQFQETLSASDKEITTFTDSKTGNQPAYVVTSSGVSQSQDVNIYSINFALPKSSITPKEVVPAEVQYESIPVGTKLIFTNNSTETVNMTIPGGVNTANQCIYTVTNTNGTIPVNVTGIKRGNFKIKLDMSFKNDNQTPR